MFCGPNGSGKSTLVAFIRQILFGSGRHDADGRGAAFLPDTWAGRLNCAGPGGSYAIAHQGDRSSPVHVARPDGGDAGGTGLDHLFHGPDGRLIGSLLVFDVNDLQSLSSLMSSGIRERLFPAGAGRGLRSVQRALETIQVRGSEIAQRASIDVHKLPTAPSELQARIEQSTRAAARLGQLLQSHAQTQLTFDLRTRTISDLRAETAKYEALVELAPVWQELSQARRELDGLDSLEHLSLDSEQRLDHALAAKQAAQRTVAQLVGHDTRGRRDAPVALDETTRGTSVTPDARFAIVRQKVRMQDPVNTGAEDLNGWERRLKEAVDAARDSEREFESTSNTVRELEAARNQLSATLSRPEPPNAMTLDEEARLVQHVRTTLAGLASDQTFTKRWQDQIAERSATIRTLETDVVSIPSKALPYLGWCAALVGIGGAAWRYAQQDVIGLGLLAAFALVCMIGAVVQRTRRKKALEEDLDRRAQLDAVRGELERACQSLLHHQERSARRRFDISVDSVRLGLPPMPSDLQLKEREAELEAQRRQRAEWNNAQATLAEHLASLARSEELRRKQAQSLMAAQAHERQTVQQWNQWKMHSGPTDGSAPRSAEGVRSEAELLETCRRLRIQISEWEQNATEWNTRARAALIGMVEPEGSFATSGGAVALAQPQTEQHSPALQAARRRLRMCEDALAQLFAQAGVSDETAYRARVASSRRRSALTQTIRSCETRCSERLRLEPAAEAIQRELNEGRFEDWRQRSARSTTELSSLESSRDEAMRQLRQLDAEISVASTESAELPVLEVERSALAAEADAIVRASRTLAIAASLLDDARRHVERESQPPALRRAAEAMSAITFSRYERLGLSDDQQDLLVLDSKNGWTPVKQLSRGTLEQLAFSLRVGLADESAERGPRLPLVIDDVLDNFDPKRSQAMARQIVEVSRRHQVLVFTRRPETCELLRTLDPTTNIITMQEL